MRTWLGKVVTLVSSASLVYSCAGKSISRPGDDGTGDDGSFTGGKGGATTGKGGSLGKGGSPGTGGRGGTSTGKGGNVGTGGSPGTGGFGGTLGKGGTGGTSIGGDDGGGFGGGECGPRRDSGFLDQCDGPAQCISLSNPTQSFVRLNQPAPDDGEGGAGGEGGSDSGASSAATATLCGVPDDQSHGFLAFDYQAPDVGAPGVQLLSGFVECGGTYFGSTFALRHRPPPGSWTTQCVPIEGIDLDRTITVRVPQGQEANTPRIKNLRFATGCECPLQVLRYTTCGNILGPLVCR